MFLCCGSSLNVCDLVFIAVHDEEKSDVSISRLYLDGTGSCCLANTTVITDIRIAARHARSYRAEKGTSSRWGRSFVSDEARNRGRPCTSCHNCIHNAPARMLLSKLAARPNKSGIAPHVETSDRELRVCAPRDEATQHRPGRSLHAHHPRVAHNDLSPGSKAKLV